jgi:hypothetical protein
MATTVTYFTDKSAAPYSHTGAGRGYARIDFSERPVAATNIVQVMNIAAGTVVRNVHIKVVTAEGATCTATVGDGDSAAGWDASTNLNATAGTITSGIVGTDARCLGAGYTYTSADTIDLVMGHATDAAVIDVIVDFFSIT